jgi:hypothetical protein
MLPASRKRRKRGCSRKTPALPRRAATIVAKFVVGEHHVGRLPGDVGAGDSHRDADVGGAQGRRVVHAVPGHGDHVAVPLQRVHDAQLVRRIDAREHRDLARPSSPAPRRRAASSARHGAAVARDPSSAAMTAAVRG